MMKIMFSLGFLALFSGGLSWYIVYTWIMVLFLYMFSTFFMSVWYGMLSYFLGGDLLTFSFSFLSFWIISLMILASTQIYKYNYFCREFLFLVIILLMVLVVSFGVNNLFMYYLFFEFSLIPTLVLIFGWGYQPERLMAGYYLLYYTLFFSLPMLLGIFYIKSFCFSLFYFLISMDCGVYLYFSMVLAFLVKMPMVFIHFWLPKAHVEAPISGSMILAGVLLKLGGYGLIRVLMILKNYDYNFFFISLSLFGMLMVGILCLFQVDMKCLIAYSSVAHMGLVICGIMSNNVLGVIGSLVMMIGHGLCSSGMFCLANMVYECSLSRSIIINKGMLTILPSMCLFWFIIMVNNMGSPPTMNLLGEMMMFMGIMSWCNYSFVYLMASSFLGCMYSIYMYSYINHGLVFKGVNFGYHSYFIGYQLLFMHIFPLNIFFMKIDILSSM
uniref:NADH-ubiquinone oxidoreductase chain 4 n=1 Tax=Mystilus priamus TaxID=2813419 RepID=A0A8T9ZXZ2_9HEMI|nr:NADH dehydrogenase subunit 4 [Mystilus priamus]